MTSTTFNDKPFVVQSPDVTYTDDEMVSKYTYQVGHTPFRSFRPVRPLNSAHNFLYHHGRKSSSYPRRIIYSQLNDKRCVPFRSDTFYILFCL